MRSINKEDNGNHTRKKKTTIKIEDRGSSTKKYNVWSCSEDRRFKEIRTKRIL